MIAIALALFIGFIFGALFGMQRSNEELQQMKASFRWERRELKEEAAKHRQNYREFVALSRELEQDSKL